MSMKELMAAGNSLSLGDKPEGVSFDGTNDYLSRSSDLTGNADGRTFTFSCWVYHQANQYTVYYGGNHLYVQVDTNGGMALRFMDTGFTGGLNGSAPGSTVPKNTWTHIIMSVDLTTLTVYVYANDVNITSSCTFYTLANADISFTGITKYVGAENPAHSAHGKGRLAHVFLDYTYRDLSVEANRRLFIDSDGKPADGQDNTDKYSDVKLDTSAQSYMNGLVFNDTGSELITISGTSVYKYTLSTSYDITTAIYSNTVSPTSLDSGKGLCFSPDGLKMYATNYALSETENIIQYSLSTAFDISTLAKTATYQAASIYMSGVTLNNDGSKIYYVDYVNKRLYQVVLTTPYDLSTASTETYYDFSVIDNQPRNLQFYNNGASALIVTNGADSIYGLSLSTPFDITTVSYTSESYYVGNLEIYPSNILLLPNGSKVVVTGSNTSSSYGINLSTPYDISTAVYGEAAGTPSSPILYLPMTDAATAGSNSGTGGDFTVNGVLDTAGRGPNQFNCSASEFDGTNDYLETTSLSVPADNKLLTFSYCYKASLTDGPQKLDFIDASDPTNVQKLCLRLNASVTNNIDFTIYNGIDMTTVAWGKYDLPGWTKGQSHCIQLSLDTSDTSKRHAFIDGVDVTSSFAWNNYNNLNIPWSRATKAIIGEDFNYGDKLGGSLGEYWVDNSYIDLSTDNPFWDSVANKPKPVSQVISETGTTPIIAMPLRADDAGNNLGSGGDFTVYSGPFTGARGGSEFWARSANFDGSTGYLTKTLSGLSDVKTGSFVFAVRPQDNDYIRPIWCNESSNARFRATVSVPDNQVTVYFQSSSGVDIVRTVKSTTINTGTFYIVMICVDTTDSTKCKMYINGVDGGSFDLVTNANIAYSSLTDANIAAYNSTGSGADAIYDQSHTYFSTSYIDFSQESNRNLFVDQLGYPKDLTPAIDAGTIPNPLIYMKFDDTSDLGKNSGTGGNFTVNGTVTAGADVDPNA
jgi:hypothetical protein